MRSVPVRLLACCCCCCCGWITLYGCKKTRSTLSNTADTNHGLAGFSSQNEWSTLEVQNTWRGKNPSQTRFWHSFLKFFLPNGCPFASALSLSLHWFFSTVERKIIMSSCVSVRAEIVRLCAMNAEHCGVPQGRNQSLRQGSIQSVKI